MISVQTSANRRVASTGTVSFIPLLLTIGINANTPVINPQERSTLTKLS